MPKFRKKPVVIEAEQWFLHKKIDGVKRRVAADASEITIYYVETLEGEMRVSPGDWIITGVKGEKYPCKSDIFEATYVKVVERTPHICGILCDEQDGGTSYCARLRRKLFPRDEAERCSTCGQFDCNCHG